MNKPIKPAKPGAELPFEKALEELENLVARMEDGRLSLEQSLAAHKRGLELAKQCRERLEAAQQQVRVLEGDVLKPFGGLSPNSATAAADGGDRD
ncbi:MAG TPA: exodeoxyribonuclease VII small subunit [Burkholderiales bacterium]|nr:exodeoxyribonuclease VII small subunit [Burkholderiales bacterium]